MKRNLITGGAGFIGAHLCKRLLDAGDEVVCLDNFYSSDPSAVEHLEGPRFTVNICDVRRPPSTWISPDDNRSFDRVWSLACPASPAFYSRDEMFTIETCVLGTRGALEFAKHNGARFLLTSTSEVYGDPTEHPQRETYRGNVDCTSPRSAYDEGKRLAETITYAYQRQHNVTVRVARLFNCFGPGMGIDDGRVVSNFIVQALRGEPLTVYGDGTQTRSLCFVDDTVDGLARLMESDVTEPVNVGNPDERTVRSIANIALAVVHGSATAGEIKYCPLPVDDPRQRRPDITRARERLGWSPLVPLEEGLRRTVDDFRRRLAL